MDAFFTSGFGHGFIHAEKGAGDGGQRCQLRGIELGIGGVHVSPLQPMPARAQPAPTHATMSGDFHWLTIA